VDLDLKIRRKALAELLIPNMAESLLERLQKRAEARGSTAEAEAKRILTQALDPTMADPWAVVDAIRERLASSGRTFTDSTELLREDRER
jgi:plasmid stability protein